LREENWSFLDDKLPLAVITSTALEVLSSLFLLLKKAVRTTNFVWVFLVGLLFAVVALGTINTVILSRLWVVEDRLNSASVDHLHHE
jgi:hypothetical protein